MPVELLYPLYVAFPFALAYAAASDLLTMTISNRISLLLIACFVALAPLTGMGLTVFAQHVSAGAVMLAVTFTLFSLGWIGGGDAKLAAVIALWFGWTPATIEFVGLSAIFGGCLTMAILGFRRTPLPAFAMRTPWVQRLHNAGAGVPYGIALAAGGLAVYPHSIWTQMLVG